MRLMARALRQAHSWLRTPTPSFPLGSDMITTGRADFLRLSCLTFNVLAPCYKRLGGGRREAEEEHLFMPRHTGITELLVEQKPDIICLQEFWFQSSVRELYEQALQEDYQLYTLKRPGLKQDGLLTCVRRDFNVKAVTSLDYEDVGSRVALLLHLEKTHDDGTSADFIVANTHLTYPHDAFDEELRMHQTRKLADTVLDFERETNAQASLIAGDMNADYLSWCCRHLAEVGFQSGYYVLNDSDGLVTHRDHRGQEAGVDHIFFKGCLTPLETIVLPKELPHTEWQKRFQLSDHRPVKAVFALQASSVSKSSSTTDGISESAAAD